MGREEHGPETKLNAPAANASGRAPKTRLALALRFIPEAERALSDLKLTTEELCVVAAFGREEETGSERILRFEPSWAPAELRQGLKRFGRLTLWIESGWVSRVSAEGNTRKEKERA